MFLFFVVGCACDQTGTQNGISNCNPVSISAFCLNHSPSYFVWSSCCRIFLLERLLLEKSVRRARHLCAFCNALLVVWCTRWRSMGSPWLKSDIEWRQQIVGKVEIGWQFAKQKERNSLHLSLNLWRMAKWCSGIEWLTQKRPGESVLHCPCMDRFGIHCAVQVQPVFRPILERVLVLQS